MKTQVTAMFVDGVLKPDESLPFAEYTRVNLTVEPIGAFCDVAATWESLKDRLQERPIHASLKRFTRDELHERR